MSARPLCVRTHPSDQRRVLGPINKVISPRPRIQLRQPSIVWERNSTRSHVCRTRRTRRHARNRQRFRRVQRGILNLFSLFASFGCHSFEFSCTSGGISCGLVATQGFLGFGLSLLSLFSSFSGGGCGYSSVFSLLSSRFTASFQFSLTIGGGFDVGSFLSFFGEATVIFGCFRGVDGFLGSFCGSFGWFAIKQERKLINVNILSRLSKRRRTYLQPQLLPQPPPWPFPRLPLPQCFLRFPSSGP